jgi:hypothetical protein
MAYSDDYDKNKVGFDIGFDFALYRLEIPELSSKSITDGYQYKKEKGGSTKRSDKFIRKWLNLRLHAFERNITYSEDLTPNKLEEMLCRVRFICPITQEKLTFGTMTGTDWSIDRLLNNFGYTEGNVTVMSTLANHAKSDLSLDKIWQIVKTGEAQEGLTHSQWQRIRDCCQKASVFLSTKIAEACENVRNAKKSDTIEAVLKIITDPVQLKQEHLRHLTGLVILTAPKKKQKLLIRHIKRMVRKRENETEEVKILSDIARSSTDKRVVKEMHEMPDWDYILRHFHADNHRIRNISQGFAASQRG